MVGRSDVWRARRALRRGGSSVRVVRRREEVVLVGVLFDDSGGCSGLEAH